MKTALSYTDIALTTVHTEGGLLPPDILEKIISGDRELKGVSPEDYHLPKGEKLNEAINRSWNRARSLWLKFSSLREAMSPADTGTTITRENLLLPLFAELGYGRLLLAKTTEIKDKPYPITHFWNHSPLHLVGCGLDLDKRARGVRGAAQASPHSMVQEFLNRSDDHQWGFVSNGLKLRILRDNMHMTRQAYVEFDLESMFAGEMFSDFVLLWLLCHQSRVEAEKQEECWLEVWAKSAQDQGVRALQGLRDNVKQAIELFGQGFLTHLGNLDLKTALRSGTLSRQDYFRQLLRLVYRLLFLFAAEDRDLLFSPDTPETTRQLYLSWYSTGRIRRMAGKLPGTRHHDLYEGLKLIMEKLGSGCTELGLSPLGSFLWSDRAMPDLSTAQLPNTFLLQAIRALAYVRTDGIRRPVDYKNIGARELGSVYESLLELHPELNAGSGTFALQTTSGNERKTTGSYYTPTSLINCLLDSALDPVVEEAMAKPDPESALLQLTICDPACGSGHFLISAAHRLAKRLAGVRTGDEEPGPGAVRAALRDVIGNCIYGVDINPMAVELCKVSLWMESMEPGKPLSFLDNHIQCGNSLLGTVPGLIDFGIPATAFTAIEGDNKPYCTRYKKENAQEHKRRAKIKNMPLAKYINLGNIATSVMDLMAVDDSSLEGVRKREAMWRDLVKSSGYKYNRLLADAWCAAFVWKKTDAFPYPITEDVFRKIEATPYSLNPWMLEEIERLAEEYQFFHFHLAFPEVFTVPGKGREAENERTGWNGGFDVVIGNPPWERIKIQEKEWFAKRVPVIAAAPNAAARGKLIKELTRTDPELHTRFLEDKRQAEGFSHIVRNSERYPLCGRGDVNTYSIFAENFRQILSPTGRVGCIVPSGIATDDTTKYFFQDLVETRTLASLYDFENRNAIFEGVHRSYKFCLLTMSGSQQPNTQGGQFAFFLHDTRDLDDSERSFTLTREDIELINPNTKTCPIFRSKKDAELTKQIYRRVPVLINENDPENGNPWGITFKRLFDMSNDSGLFRTRQDMEDQGWELKGNVFKRDDEKYLPLYEAKMIHHFDHRWATYEPDGSIRKVTQEEKADPDFAPMPRYWVPEWEVIKRGSQVSNKLIKAYEKGDEQKLQQAMQEELGEEYEAYVAGDIFTCAEKLIEERCPKWFLGWRDICRSTDERTVISCRFPRCGCGDTLLLMFPDPSYSENFNFLIANFNSFVLDYAARQKIGGTHMKYHVFKQLPLLSPPIRQKLSNPEIKNLSTNNPYFLNALFFKLYNISRHDIEYIMDTFEIIKRKETEKYGEYITKKEIMKSVDLLSP